MDADLAAGHQQPVVLGRPLALPHMQGHGGGAAAGSARAGLPHTALQYAQTRAPHPITGDRIHLLAQRHHELEIGTGLRHRLIDHRGPRIGQTREGGGIELALLPQGDHGMRIGHGDRQGRTLALQARHDDDGIPPLILDIGQGAVGMSQARRSHIDRPQIAHAGNGARSPASADGDGIAIGHRAEPLSIQNCGEQTRGVAAHLRHGTIGVVVVHEPLGLGHGLVKGLRTGQRSSAHDPHESIGPDSGAPIARSGDVGGGHRHIAFGIDEQEEIVLRAVALDELVARKA